MSTSHRPSAPARHTAGRARRPAQRSGARAGRLAGARALACRRWAARDRGSVTAELAAGLPALMMLLLVGLTAVSAVTTKLRAVDAAREAARTVARGEPPAGAGPRSGLTGAEVSVSIAGDTVTATVRAPVRPLGSRLPPLVVHATAVAAMEPGVPEPAP